MAVAWVTFNSIGTPLRQVRPSPLHNPRRLRTTADAGVQEMHCWPTTILLLRTDKIDQEDGA